MIARPAPADHIPELDGIRGLAILPVLMIHVCVAFPQHPRVLDVPMDEWLGWGWVGVDLFFALSGYLITGILRRTCGAPGYFRTFYIRRALRIFPLYYLALAAGGLAALAGLSLATRRGADATQFRDLLDSYGWFWVYLQNFPVLFDGRPTPMLGHLWSLAVEEHFYLLWPLCVLLIPPARLLIAIAVLLAGLPVLRWALAEHGIAAKSIYLASATHCDGLLAGAAAALLGELAPRWWGRRLRWMLIALCSLAFLACTLHDRCLTPYRGPWLSIAAYTALGVAAACLVSEAVERRWSWLRLAWLRLAGKYSYGLYVVHWPVMIGTSYVITQGLLGSAGALLARPWAFAPLVLALSAACAMASWHLYESRFLRLKDRWTG